MTTMNETADPLRRHLLDILSDPASEGLILAGGYGLRLKQIHSEATDAGTLFPVVPEARATQDLDFFLRLALFAQKERGIAVRSLIDRLGYEEHTPRWQFGKPSGPDAAGRTVKIDLLARPPAGGEAVRVKGRRVGSGSGVDLHGRETPEAFAVEDSPLRLPVSGTNSRGESIDAAVHVPHPYAWLTMKVAAAHDWLRRERGELPPKPNGGKHVFDVYVLTAMLTEAEISEGAVIAGRYEANPVARDVRDWARELYGSIRAPGVREVLRQTGREFDYPLFWEGLRAGLSLPEWPPG